VIPWPSGRTLGGSSSINGMIYIRGNPLDYDDWRDAFGCAGWGHGDLLPYFLRAEDQQRGGSAWHGTGGPLRVEDQRYEHPLSRAWLEAAIAWGLPGNPAQGPSARVAVELSEESARSLAAAILSALDTAIPGHAVIADRR
jgi:choline dehydrogenase-like flavoprotein